MSLATIRLELARTPEFPGGSAAHGYEFHAPLTADGHLDLAAFSELRERCVVRRFWGGALSQGRLQRTGAHGWAFSYAPGVEDDERFHKLEQHRFVLGDYVTIQEHDGTTRTFRVASVT
jgi:hypothetical protein